MDAERKQCVTTTIRLLAEGRYNDYEAVFDEWVKDQVMEILPEEELKILAYYLPHQGVFKKNTTKIRLVFDASCRGKDAPFLNGCLEKGPNLIQHIHPVIMQFQK
jgi:hypothetical protein